jgi:hypothetical protein
VKLSLLFPEVSNVERAVQRIARLERLGFHSEPCVNRYIGVFGFRDGRSCEWHEFHSPDVPARAFAPV